MTRWIPLFLVSGAALLGSSIARAADYDFVEVFSDDDGYFLTPPVINDAGRVAVLDHDIGGGVLTRDLLPGGGLGDKEFFPVLQQVVLDSGTEVTGFKTLLQGVALNDGGIVAFLARTRVSDGEMPTLGDGLFALDTDTGSFRTVVTTQASAPPDLIGYEFVGFDGVDVNDGGTAGFTARIRPGGSGTTSEALYTAAASGTLTPIYVESPGVNLTYRTLLMRDDGSVTFFADAGVSGATIVNGSGNGQLTPLVDTGGYSGSYDQSDGGRIFYRASEFDDEFNETSSLVLDGSAVVTVMPPTSGPGFGDLNLFGFPWNQLAVNETGIVFLVPFRDADSNLHRGLFGGGNVESDLIFGTNQQLFGQDVDSIEFENLGFNDAGVIVFNVEFANGDHSVVAAIPAPEPAWAASVAWIALGAVAVRRRRREAR